MDICPQKNNKILSEYLKKYPRDDIVKKTLIFFTRNLFPAGVGDCVQIFFHNNS